MHERSFSGTLLGKLQICLSSVIRARGTQQRGVRRGPGGRDA
jgi:hypothetical protein